MEMPEGAQMPFAQFVLNALKADECVIGEGFMGGDYIVPRSAIGEKYQERCAYKLFIRWIYLVGPDTDKDYFCIGQVGWFNRFVIIHRGPQRFKIKVRGDLAKKIGAEIDRLYQRNRDLKKKRKLVFKEAEKRAAWWP